MQMTIYDAATVGSRSNCVYPNPVTVTDADTMRQAAAFDHVCAAYKQNYRSVDNFLKADCLPMDCDNDHSDDPDDWLTPFDVAMDFPGVGMIFVYSRSHMKQKGKRGPRPRFHVYFICTETTNSEIYSSWKDRLIADYPYFDDGAKDSARFLFGVKNAAVEVYDGEIRLDLLCGENKRLCCLGLLLQSFQFLFLFFRGSFGILQTLFCLSHLSGHSFQPLLFSLYLELRHRQMFLGTATFSTLHIGISGIPHEIKKVILQYTVG